VREARRFGELQISTVQQTLAWLSLRWKPGPRIAALPSRPAAAATNNRPPAPYCIAVGCQAIGRPHTAGWSGTANPRNQQTL